MKKLKELIRHIWYAAPILVTLFTLLYFSFMYDNYRSSLVDQLYKEKISTTKKIINELDNVNMISGNVTDKEFKAFLIALVQSIDSEHAIYARVFDIHGNLLSEPKIADTESEYIKLYDTDKFDFDGHMNLVRQHPEGSAIVTVDGYNLMLHWFSYPKSNTVYHVFIGISPDRVVQTLDLNKFTYGLIGIIVVMLIFAYYNVFLISSRIRLRKEITQCKKIKECDAILD